MKILSFGSLNLDLVYDVEHFVCAGETMSSNRLEKFCGGKGLNQSIALARAGAEVYHAGMVGQDGMALTQLLLQSNVNTRYIKVCDTPTGHAIIQVMPSGQNCILLYGGANRQITEAFIDEVLRNFDKGDLILLQNEINYLPYLIKAAHQKEMLVALNLSPYNEVIEDCNLEFVDFFLLNEVEGYQLTGKKDADGILSEMRRRFVHSRIVLTLGKAGAIYDDSTIRCQNGIYDVQVVDTTAAGDTFTGYFLAATCRGKTPQDALMLASKASSLAVSTKGASNSIPSLIDVVNYFDDFQ